jgi:predicted Holliday junction resolvase-like endonuclease
MITFILTVLTSVLVTLSVLGLIVYFYIKNLEKRAREQMRGLQSALKEVNKELTKEQETRFYSEIPTKIIQ